jgi:cell division protein FtsQ
MKIPKLNISYKWYLLFASFVVAGISIFFFVQTSYKTVRRISVDLNNDFDNYFIDEKEVLSFVTLNDTDPLVGKYLDNVDLKEIEVRIKKCPYVDKVQVYKNLTGVIKIDVEQVRPIARLFRDGYNDKYLLENGRVINISPKYTSRSLVVRGSFLNRFYNASFVNSELGKSYISFFNYINQDELWSMQISEVYVDADGTIRLYPQVGDFEIKFGMPDELDEKFKKIKIFYNEIIPSKGWLAYQSVDVQFKKQIICD